MIRRCESREDGERCCANAVAEVGPANYYGAQAWNACARHAKQAELNDCDVSFDSEVSQ